MDAPAHDGLLHGEAGRDRGERENESGTHHREVTWGWRRGRGVQRCQLGGLLLFTRRAVYLSRAQVGNFTVHRYPIAMELTLPRSGPPPDQPRSGSPLVARSRRERNVTSHTTSCDHARH